MNQTTLLPNGQKIAFIQAGWHADIVAEARKSFLAELEPNIPASCVDVFDVPGSLEIPLQAKLLAQSGQYAIIVGCGFIINGGIYRHDFVASTVIDAIMQVQLETEVPVLSVILTPHHFHGSDEHHKFFFDHFKIKGKEAAEACVQTLANINGARQLKQAA